MAEPGKFSRGSFRDSANAPLAGFGFPIFGLRKPSWYSRWSRMRRRPRRNFEARAALAALQSVGL
jgi:hypothetical protein